MRDDSAQMTPESRLKRNLWKNLVGWGKSSTFAADFGKSDASEDVRRVVMKAAPHLKDVILNNFINITNHVFRQREKG